MKFQRTCLPLFLIPFLAACQSVKNDPLALVENGKQKILVSQSELTNESRPQGQTSASTQSALLPDTSLSSADSNDKQKDSSLAKIDRQQPQRFSIIKFKDDDNLTEVNSDEIIDSEELSSMDDSVLYNNPNDFLQDTISSAKNNPLMCNDGLFYQSWSAQFDKQWLAKYSKNYPKAKAKNKALSLARTNEFIRLVYPAIEKTGYDFPVEINSQVLSWIGYFTGVGRKNFVVWLERGQSFIPDMKKTLEQNGLPSDLVYLSMIESGYSTKSLSNVGAVGLWQFMPGTAKEYGLKINDWLDERRDVVKSTQAASRYLNDLYTRFGSWHLAAAGYNGGPGLVSKTLRNYGEDSSFFELTSKKRMNSQTANYVPKILAAMIVAKNPSIFGFDSAENSVVNQVKTIPIERSITLADLAQSIHVDKGVLESLNPQLRLGITPPPKATTEGKYNLVVPASTFDRALASISTLPDAPTKHLVAARIKHMEKVASFAKRYKINVASLLESNKNLKANSSLKKGQVVYIAVSLGSGQYDKLTTVKFNHHSKHHKSHSHHKKRIAKGHAHSASEFIVKSKNPKTNRLATVD